MNILFVYSLNNYHFQTLSKPAGESHIQFGISYISALLKKNGHKTKLVVLSNFLGRRNKNIIDGYLKEFKPELICFTAVTTEFPFIRDLAGYIKKRYPDVYLLIGGPHVSLNPEEFLSADFDALCIGEGEGPALELVSQIEKRLYPTGIQNLWIKHGKEIERNPPRPFFKNLDALPFPDREMWRKWIDAGEKNCVVVLSRGCPFQCSYCCNHALSKLASGDYIRFRSPDSIIQEIREITAIFPEKKEIFLETEAININKKWAMELCSRLELFNLTRDQPLSFGTNLRITPDADLESLFSAFKRSNFKIINIGLESGSEKIRYNILKRNYSNKDIFDAVRLARRHDLRVAFFNLIGIPGETINDFRETVKINKICLPDFHYTSIFFPYPGTDLYFLCKKEGLIKGALDVEMERTKATLNLRGFSKKQIQKSFVWFEYYVYKGHKPLYKILAKVAYTKFESKACLSYYLYKRFLENCFKVKSYCINKILQRKH